MIYFDNSATTKPHPDVLTSYTEAAQTYFANPSSLHRLGGSAEQLLTACRKQAAQLLHVGENEILFTSGGTEGNNLAIKGTALQKKRLGNHIITTTVEHPSVLETCAELENQGFKVTYVDVDKYGYVTAEKIKAAITDQTILVSVMHVNNELGTIQPIKTIGQMLTEFPHITFHVDHVQGAGKVALDIKKSNIHLCTLSAHKFHGMKGSGILYKAADTRIVPQLSGGGQEQALRSGTENVPGITAMVKALRLAMEELQVHPAKLFELRERLWAGLGKMDDVVLHSPPAGAPHIVNFSVPGLKPEVLVHALGEKDIYVSTKSACSSKNSDASAVLLACGVPDTQAESAIRVSFSYDNTQQEVDYFLQILEKTLTHLKKVMR
ncbi:cysteine desulfurase NifS [Terribacillus saccharophilus]|uniref:cysteine desulfurase family protein n=1 Tax=Terribacillus saccharophilus TaxID=361277 RepID=UPI000BA72677|nr:cysteine desulfurase family protein [Terribacillus saccharophilus]PAF19991.1 cysteine desulfurase NifS [Terribacillus saccharophilus]PAF20250.1 cysteine desulfurase NifS [Terribacillus saccharophilus]PAF36246.1 cysteine desulfurase NifS [Terribacillus saccharophilus]